MILQDGRLRLDRERLKQHRKRLGLSQEALAEYCFDRRLCVSIASIKRAESGKAVLYRTARHLAEIYEVEVEVEVEELSVKAEEPKR
ncbi:helix-turn-helix domain-containing protein [Halomonas sp. MCCC 1A11058]|uniref:Helix-turn-helix domain-containing protein n=1 Tax=Billgrantia aerodenitrificans TaxID=2733483 RepID=A0ABS9AV92_9GAMM|nr:helix-turn-helix domain-containing protein [Halomonas aerodenitrificans]